MKINVRYLFHSGFAVETENHMLVFDYWKNTPKGGGLDSGVIDPAALAEKKVVVFVSHRHGDHYNREILGWAKQVPGLHLVLSDDIPPEPGALMVGPNKTVKENTFTVHTFASTDEGVAFLVEVEGLCLYHAGDLNWWHWAGESDAYNGRMARDYQRQIELLAGMGKRIDLAFVPVDPRLGQQSRWGLDYLMETADVARVIPMHFWEDIPAVERLFSDPGTAGYRDRIIALTQRGETREFDIQHV